MRISKSPSTSTWRLGESSPAQPISCTSTWSTKTAGNSRTGWRNLSSLFKFKNCLGYRFCPDEIRSYIWVCLYGTSMALSITSYNLGIRQLCSSLKLWGCGLCWHCFICFWYESDHLSKSVLYQKSRRTGTDKVLKIEYRSSAAPIVGCCFLFSGTYIHSWHISSFFSMTSDIL